MESIILLHGALGTSADFRLLEQKLKVHGLSLYSFDFSGHGTTAFGKGFGISQFSNELERFIIKKSLNNATIFGFSMGGYVALHLAANKPGLIKRIITYATKFNWTPDVIEKEAGQCNIEFLKHKAPEFFSALETKHKDVVQLLEKTAQMIRNFNKENFLPQDNLSAIDCEVTVGLGDKDKLVTFEETNTVFKSLKSGGMYVLAKSRHPLESADPQLLADLIRSVITGK